MNLSKIVEPLQQAAADRDAAAAAACQSKEADEASLRRIHADKLHALFAEIVGPLLATAAAQLDQLGFRAIIERKTTNDARLAPNQVIHTIQFQFQGKRLRGPAPKYLGVYSLEYLGDVEKFTVTACESLNSGSCVIADGYNMPVVEVTQDRVEQQIEGFVERAMKAETGANTDPPVEEPITLAMLQEQLAGAMADPAHAKYPVYVEVNGQRQPLGQLIVWFTQSPNGGAPGWACLGAKRTAPLVRLVPPNRNQSQTAD